MSLVNPIANCMLTTIVMKLKRIKEIPSAGVEETKAISEFKIGH